MTTFVQWIASPHRYLHMSHHLLPHTERRPIGNLHLSYLSVHKLVIGRLILYVVQSVTGTVLKRVHIQHENEALRPPGIRKLLYTGITSNAR